MHWANYARGDAVVSSTLCLGFLYDYDHDTQPTVHRLPNLRTHGVLKQWHAINNSGFHVIHQHKLSTIVEFYLYPTVGTVLIHSVKPELTE